MFDFSMLEYSVDMVRIQADIKRSEFVDLFKICENDPNVGYKEMTSISAYRHNFFIKDQISNLDPNYQTFLHGSYAEIVDISKLDSCSFWVGVGHNARFDKSKYIDIVIEYNPNKCCGSYYLDYILRSCFVGKVTSYLVLT